MGEPKLEGVKTALKICQGIKIGGQCPNSCPLLAACQMGCGGAPRMILDCIQQLEAVQDRLIDIIREYCDCEFRLHRDRDMSEEPCLRCMDNELWEQCGMQKEVARDD